MEGINLARPDKAKPKGRTIKSSEQQVFKLGAKGAKKWKSPRGGVNRAKLKFSKIITTTSRVSVRNIIESTREGGKQIAGE
jgi:hypothetical protein